MRKGFGAFTMSTAVLQQDACIIEEQDEHLVLTLRISKETVLKNHALLAGLSDAVSGPDKLRAPPKHRHKRRFWPYWGVISLPLLLPTTPYIGDVFASYPPPVHVESIAPAKSTFKVGENIEIDFVYNRDRVCQTTFDHLIATNTNETPVFTTRAYGASVGSTHGMNQYFRLILKPPAPLAPGKYVYIGYNYSICAEGGTYDIAYPHVEFTVEG